MIMREREISIYFLDRRVIYDYEKYGDSPACLGEIGKDGKSGQIGVSEVECAKIWKKIKDSILIFIQAFLDLRC